MTRFLRLALVAAALSAMSIPVFAIGCRECDENGVCVSSPDSGTRCHFTIDGCVTVGATCTGLADQDTLDTITIASVEVATPAGVKTAGEAPRLAQRQSATPTGAATTFTR